jgi:hypothetical protein
MKTIMKLEDLTTIDQLEDFLSGTRAAAFSVLSNKDACYRWIQGERVKFRYLRPSRQGKGAVIRYLMKISAYCPRAPSRGLRPLTLSRSYTLSRHSQIANAVAQVQRDC